jgi:hypothetical protein
VGSAVGTAADPVVRGALLFARYAYPPNERGFCGPDDHASMFSYAASGEVDGGLADLARAFNGAWPYLELISGATGVGPPLHERVVEAYWIGNDLLDGVDLSLFGNSLRDRFRERAGTGWGYLEEAIPAGSMPHHSFHVFCVYPWVGLLDAYRGDHPLHILDRCRIRWGRVEAVRGDAIDVVSRPLQWDGRKLYLGEARPEEAIAAVGGAGLAGPIEPGDWVAMHWNWVCDRLTVPRLRRLVDRSRRQLFITNHQLAHPGPAMTLG